MVWSRFQFTVDGSNECRNSPGRRLARNSSTTGTMHLPEFIVSELLRGEHLNFAASRKSLQSGGGFGLRNWKYHMVPSPPSRTFHGLQYQLPILRSTDYSIHSSMIASLLGEKLKQPPSFELFRLSNNTCAGRKGPSYQPTSMRSLPVRIVLRLSLDRDS